MKHLIAGRRLLLIPVGLWLFLFSVLPLGFLIVMSLWKSDIFGITPEWNIDNYKRFFEEPVYIRVFVSTIRISLITAIASIIIGYPIAWMISRLEGRRKGIALLLLFLPFWTSFLIRTFAWIPILGRQGAINSLLLSLGLIDKPIDALLFNEGTIYLGLLYIYILYMVLPIYLSLEKMDPALIEAAQDLGATPLQVFLKVTLPLSLPGVISGTIMVFLLCCGAFVTPQLLGGPSAIMFGNLVAGQFIGDNNWAFGSALAVVMMAIVIGLMLAVARFFGFTRLFLER